VGWIRPTLRFVSPKTRQRAPSERLERPLRGSEPRVLTYYTSREWQLLQPRSSVTAEEHAHEDKDEPEKDRPVDEFKHTHDKADDCEH
jgi:hypothetical protein